MELSRKKHGSMKHVCGVLFLSLSLLLGSAIGSWTQEDPIQQRHAYLEAISVLLKHYLKEQNAWNHYFTTIAPEQSAGEQMKPQETYRRFLADTLVQWRQVKVVSTCQSPHLLYELALHSYSVAADFRLTFLYARSTLLGSQKAAALAEERSRFYTTLGDDYFKKAALLAQASNCIGPAPTD
jgi:hypothetical protein